MNKGLIMSTGPKSWTRRSCAFMKKASLEAIMPQISLTGENGAGSAIIIYSQGFDLSNPESFFILLKGGLDKSSPYKKSKA